MKPVKSFREHQDQLAEFGRRIAEEQGVETAAVPADWVAFGAACRQARARGRNVPLLLDFHANPSEMAPEPAPDSDIEPLAVTRRRRNVGGVASGSLLESLKNELVEVRRRLTHYARQSTELELRLEQVDREQQRGYRRAQELAEAIETEEEEQLQREAIAIVQSRPAVRPEQRHGEILAIMARHPEDEVTPAALALAMTITRGYAYLLLSQMIEKGLVRRVGRGRYRSGQKAALG